MGQRHTKISQRRVTELLRKFCEFLQRTFPLDPYDFSGKMFEIHEGGVQITTQQGEVRIYVF